MAPSQPDDELPVVWSFYHGGSWKVNWTDKDGKRHSNAVSYVVPDKDEHGKLLEQDAYNMETKKTYQRAIKAWNSLDFSDRPRFVDSNPDEDS